jgi:formylglycine-generating enzyme required for sulfatase activity
MLNRFCLAILASFILPLFLRAQEVPLQAKVSIPGTEVTFRLALLPAGTFQMGDTAAQHVVRVDSFWIGICEVTWDEFYCFSNRKMDSDNTLAPEGFAADAVARPTPPYFDFTYGRGRAGGFPAATMTQQAALRYCQWLSDKTGDFYRLPTEAEWEYACRAGTTTAWSWGDDPALAGDHAWYYANSSSSYQKVGSKKPNPWGLHDMHGNVTEWTLDYYVDNYYQRLDTAAVNPLIEPSRKHSRTVRGGSFEDYVDDLGSAVRRKSDPKWQARDPQMPKSRWWNPDAPFVGFRIVRDMRQLDKSERDAFFEKMIRD